MATRTVVLLVHGITSVSFVSHAEKAISEERVS